MSSISRRLYETIGTRCHFPIFTTTNIIMLCVLISPWMMWHSFIAFASLLGNKNFFLLIKMCYGDSALSAKMKHWFANLKFSNEAVITEL